MLTGCGAAKQEQEKKEPIYASMGCSVYENGMIYSRDPIMYMDFDTMEHSVLCAKPNCNHTTLECVAKLVGDSPIIYNDYLYYFSSSQKVEETGNGEREYVIRSKLCRVSLDSSESEDLVSFSDCVPRDYDGWLIIDDTVWFTGDDMNPTPDEYGNINAGNAGGTHFICSIDLKAKKYTNYGSVYDGDKEFEGASNTSSAQIKGLYDSKIMIRYEFAKEPVPIILDEDFDYKTLFTELMFEFDPVTKELAPSDLKEPSYVDEDTYVYSDNGKTFIIDKGTEYVLDEETDTATYFVNGKLFDSYNDRWFDISDMSEHSLGEYSYYGARKYYDNCYILSGGNAVVKLTEEELLALE